MKGPVHRTRVHVCGASVDPLPPVTAPLSNPACGRAGGQELTLYLLHSSSRAYYAPGPRSPAPLTHQPLGPGPPGASPARRT